MNKTITVTGIDPALRNFGLVKMQLDLQTLKLSLVDAITVSTEKMTGKTVRQNSDDLRRGRVLYDGMQKFIEGSKIVFAEIPSGSQRARAALGFGIAIGVLASCPVPVIEVMPLDTKMASVGIKTATKPQIIQWAADLYPGIDWVRYEDKARKTRVVGSLHDDNEHVADACAIIHAGLRTTQFQQLHALLKVN